MDIQNFIPGAIPVAKEITKKIIGKLWKSTTEENKRGIISYREEENNNIVCFVHGFSGKPESTFTPMPEFLVAENELKGWDVLSIGYSTDLLPNIGTGIWSADPDINTIAKYLQTNLNILFQHYSRVALIGHSMGGLVIQRALLNHKDINKISHVFFFGTPSAGLYKAAIFKWFKNQVADMSNDGEFIKNLRSDWNERFKDGYPFKFLTVAGQEDEFVPRESSLQPFAEEFHCITTGTHIQMVKPVTADDTSFAIIKNMIADKNNFMVRVNSKTLNNTVAKYYEDVIELGKKINQLDSNGLKQYIFALEGIGKVDEAITAIEESEKAKTNTDFMGILGGRWKRKYLKEPINEYLQKAIGWYNKALQLSKAANNSGQIYYHAINLAFLFLMEDETSSIQYKEMAQLALEHCQKEKSGKYWEDATIAEAYLYLNDFEKSKTYYTEAVKKLSGSLRETNSMRINAIYACNSLNRNDWKNEIESILVVS